MSKILLQCEDIHRKFLTGSTLQHVLQGVDFHVEEGEMVSLVGPSGAGKSTLLHILGLLDPPDLGRIFIKGRRVDNLTGAGKAKIRNRDIGFVFQFYHLVPELTALQNVLLSGMMTHSLPSWFLRRSKLHRRALDLLDRMDMIPHLHKRPNKLSGGERQRVALARALFSAPPLIFCDEPTGNLDQATAAEIMTLLFDVNREEGTAFIIVTHDEHVAQRVSRQVHMVDGKVTDRTNPPPPPAMGNLIVPDLE